MWLFALIIVLVVGGVAVVAVGTGGSMATEYDDRPDALVPAEGPISGDDLRNLRLSTAVRGYRASEVDALLDRLADQLDGKPAAAPQAAPAPAPWPAPVSEPEGGSAE
ncbi:DivIVA domain-containing protein [Nocardioides marmorisolisilvae]|uniref:DivIVA domain-containing protein n=2 Tax=Nocardioides marmorisolisilvae TaxID=1542737 RepID=A0A3N0DXE9_9ACTN|nr:DivIVA domain-containing protein [Nocardioides marmorisolisilvae]